MLILLCLFPYNSPYVFGCENPKGYAKKAATEKIRAVFDTKNSVFTDVIKFLYS